jgi:hypothetical protein
VRVQVLDFVLSFPSTISFDNFNNIRMSDSTFRNPDTSILDFGFRLLSFDHIYTPFIPLIPLYQLLYGCERGVIVDTIDLQWRQGCKRAEQMPNGRTPNTLSLSRTAFFDERAEHAPNRRGTC